MIDSKYIKKIYASAREYGFDNDTLHDLVFSETGKESIKLLTVAEAIAVINRISDVKKADIKCTQKQYNMIFALSYDLGWNGDLSRINGFIKKLAGIDNIRWINKKQASSVIEAMKKMVDRLKKCDTIKEG